MPQIELSAGTVEYEDTGGDGPALVLLPGLLMDSSLWDQVTADVAGGHRCVVPTLPMGAHRLAAADDADLSLRGMARLVGELLERLDLRHVTLVGNDTGGALVQLLIAGTDDDRSAPAAAATRSAALRRIDRIVLVSCDAFDNFPPGLTGKTLVMTGRLPAPLFGAFMQQMRVRPVRRLPIAFGWLTKRGDASTARWMRPILHDRRIRRDTVRLLRAAAHEKTALLDAADGLATFPGPALVVWASEDRVMPPEHGRRLADLLPQGRLVEVADSYTLIPLDQPGELAEIIGDFVRTTTTAEAPPVAAVVERGAAATG